MIYGDGFSHEDIERGCLEGMTIYQILLSIISRQFTVEYVQKLLTDHESSEDYIYKLKQDHLHRTIDLTIITDKDTEAVRDMFNQNPRIKLVGVYPCRDPIPKLEYGILCGWIKQAHKAMLSYQFQYPK